MWSYLLPNEGCMELVKVLFYSLGVLCPKESNNMSLVRIVVALDVQIEVATNRCRCDSLYITSRKLGLQFRPSRIGHLGFTKFERLQVGKFGQVFQSRIAHFGVEKIERVQIG